MVIFEYSIDLVFAAIRVAPDHVGIFRQMLQQRRRLRIQQRAVTVECRKISAVAQLFEFARNLLAQSFGFINRTAFLQIVTLRIEQNLQLVGDACAFVAREKQFTRRRQSSTRYLLGRTLRFDIEQAQRIDFIAPQFKANRIARRRRKEIDNTAASRELSARFHFIDALETDARKMR